VASCRALASRARLQCLVDNREILLIERDLKYDADQTRKEQDLPTSSSCFSCMSRSQMLDHAIPCKPPNYRVTEGDLQRKSYMQEATSGRYPEHSVCTPIRCNVLRKCCPSERCERSKDSKRASNCKAPLYYSLHWNILIDLLGKKEKMGE
jgi:hypothetical protein